MKVKVTDPNSDFETVETLEDDGPIPTILAQSVALVIEVDGTHSLRYCEIPDGEAEIRAERDRFKALYEATRTTAETLRAVVEDLAESRMSRAETIEKARRAIAEVGA